MSELIERTKQIRESLELEQLVKLGVEREDIKVSSHSHHIVTYPPLSVLPEIDPSKIYSFDSSVIPRKIAVYLHLPFCTGKCLYCAYFSLPNQSKNFIEKYIDGVEKEIDMLLKFPDLQNVTVNSVYIGGGTPTYLSAQQLDRVLKLIISKFDIKSDAEISVEAGPETIFAKDGKEKLETLLQDGVNRISTGFQSFDNNILRLIRRRHNSEQAIGSYKIIKEVGFENINIDLIPGLPDQTLDIWQNDLEQIGRLEPASVTCYPLSIKQTAAIWPMYQKERERFPSRENIILMHIMTNEFFNELGYTQRPVWWYTRNQKYVFRQQIHKWGESGEMLALGVAGYSFINDFQYFNYRTVPQYLEPIKNNNLPIWRGIKLSKEDLMRRLILFGLKVGLSKKLFESKFNKKPKDIFRDVWKKLEALGLIEENRGIIELSYKGRLFADEVCKEFYSDDVKRLI